jgi:hypothetical protein
MNVFVAAIDADEAVNVAAARPDVPAGDCDVAMSFAVLASDGPTDTWIARIQ